MSLPGLCNRCQRVHLNPQDQCELCGIVHPKPLNQDQEQEAVSTDPPQTQTQAEQSPSRKRARADSDSDRTYYSDEDIEAAAPKPSAPALTKEQTTTTRRLLSHLSHLSLLNLHLPAAQLIPAGIYAAIYLSLDKNETSSDTRSQAGDIDASIKKYMDAGWTLAFGPATDDEEPSLEMGFMEARARALERELAEARAVLKLWVQGGLRADMFVLWNAEKCVVLNRDRGS